ncbi:MAG: trypsin-like peptidase domain-containing protein [Pseudomonadota bacterium]
MSGLFSWLFGRSSGAAEGADLDPNAPPPQSEPIALESIIGEDERRTIADVEKFPWRPLCLLRLQYSDGQSAIGTGLLIRPNLILTAAHNLFALDLKTFATAITAEVGVKEGRAEAEARVNRVEVCPGYTKVRAGDARAYTLDFGVARVDTTALHDWAGQTIDVLAHTPFRDGDLKRSRLNVAGYPDELGGVRLKSADGPVRAGSVKGPTFSYEMDTLAGQSGGPVFRYHAEKEQVLYAGVHVAGGETANMARRFDGPMQRQVRAWVRDLT